jgi:galactokinase/mevalonate kinase-like predicted kinase
MLNGAGGGGYLLFVAPPEKVRVIADQIKGIGVITHLVELNKSGDEVWCIGLLVWRFKQK